MDIDELLNSIRMAYRDKVENAMVAVSLAEGGDFDSAQDVLNEKTSWPSTSSRPSLPLSGGSTAGQEDPARPPGRAPCFRIAARGEDVMRVLIVDDEQAFAEPLAQRLELRGIEAAVAGDAETALDMLSRQEWDLVFLDVCLPGMDGVSLLKLFAGA